MFYRTPSLRLTGLVAAAIVSAAASAANAAPTWNVVSDTSSQATTYIFPTVQTITNSIGPLYTTNGGPNVTTSGGNLTFDFTNGLSAAYKAWTNIAVASQSTDGKLILTLHFDTPVSISANIFEGGLYSTTGNGSVSVGGGEFVIEAVNPLPVETRTSGLASVFNQTGGWTATASTTPFFGVYQDYRIVVDNDLIASATSGNANIYKKSFILQIIPGGGGNPPVPEPASLGLLGLGALGLLARRRRR